MKKMVTVMICLIFASCASTQRGSATDPKILSGAISVSPGKCAVEPGGEALISCEISSNESEGMVLALTFPRAYYAASPSCVFQGYGSRKPGQGAVHPLPEIVLISSSEVRVQLPGIHSKRYAGDIVMNFICAR